MSEPILEMRECGEEHFGGVRAIDEFSLKVEPGHDLRAHRSQRSRKNDHL